MIFISPIYLCSLHFCQLSYHTSPYEHHKILSVLLKKFTMESNAHILDGKEELCGEKIIRIAPTSGNRNTLITISVRHGILIAPMLYCNLWDSLEKKKYKTTSSIVKTLWSTELSVHRTEFYFLMDGDWKARSEQSAPEKTAQVGTASATSWPSTVMIRPTSSSLSWAAEARAPPN